MMNTLLSLCVLLIVISSCEGDTVYASPSSSSTSSSTTWFTSNSAWNAPLPDDAPLSHMSTTYVAGLVYQVAKYGPWINYAQYSTPIYRVNSSEPTVFVRLNKPGGNPTVDNLAAAFKKVPIPKGAVAAPGTDKHMTVWNYETDEMWEMWEMRLENTTQPGQTEWVFDWGGYMQKVSQNPGFFTAPYPSWGATATSLPLLGGIMTIDELKAGQLNHAVCFAVVETMRGKYVAPAQRDDGWTNTTTSIPEGTRFRLPANLNLDTLTMHPFARIMAKAIQKYGMILRDTSGAITFYGEQVPIGMPDPYPSFFNNDWANNILKTLPWTYLQAVDPSWQPWA